MSTEQKPSAGTAIWYFVGATFAATLGPTLLNPGPGHWSTTIWVGFAGVLLVLGGIVVGRELRQRRAGAD